MTKPIIADLFCKAGGSAMGYHQAGFDVIGFDIETQPNYPFKFYKWDVMTLTPEWLAEKFDAIHASPPCQAYTRSRTNEQRKSYPDLVAPTRALLEASGLPYIIENVVGAPLINPLILCGSSFGLPLRRHRLFESNVALTGPACDHGWQFPRFQSLQNGKRKSGSLASVIGVHGNIQYEGEFMLRCVAMGIDWMNNAELTQAIPPAYTRCLGEQLIQQTNTQWEE